MTYKNLTYTIRKGRQRFQGYEIPLFVINADKKEHNIVMHFEKEPDEKEINDMCIFWLDKILEEVEQPEERMYLESEILEILKLKNIISNTVMKIEDITKIADTSKEIK